jgi:hypothetical protein
MKLLCREVPTPPISPDAFLAFHNFSPWHEKKAHKSQNAGYPRFSVGTAEGLLFVVVSVVLEAGCSMESDFLRFLRHHTNEASDI